ncbi:potassium channel protein [Pontibacillus yanchengensis]|uniref:Potassium channel protein n=2 Tax=Pontibacillus yanchengensis TaxID=462910 RepID=A0ACC7VKN0_9BACI|nr:potassium channel family protein [Pontibacillus yanchengensis]MYL33779.1 potassium channel protein [Pontibacillus yanchengensis]MYL55323.1 potassium channel protein [Pontibacillus yanchengensis]
MSVHTFFQWYFRTPVFLRLLLTVAFFMVFFGVIIHWIEPEVFPTIFDGIWWAIITGSTVGYGDFVPVTIIGKVFGILLIIAGGGLVTFYMATVSSSTVKYEQDLSKGKVEYRGAGHVIFIGWNERTKQLIDMIREFSPNEKVVLVDSTLETIPYKEYSIHYVQGNGSEDETLKRANINQARAAIITSDPSMKERQADQASILATVAIRGMNADIFIISEILTKEQITNAKRAGANTIVRSNDFMSTLFFHELYRKGHVKPFDTLVSQLSTQQYKQLEVPDELIGETFQTCSFKFMEQEELLLGIEKAGEIKINPPAKLTLDKSDRLLVLSALRQ